MSQIESTLKASMLALKNSFSGHKVLLFFRAILEFVYLLKTAQQWKKESGCATPKENISRISAVDEEHFLVFSLFWTQVNKMGGNSHLIFPM